MNNTIAINIIITYDEINKYEAEKYIRACSVRCARIKVFKRIQNK